MKFLKIKLLVIAVVMFAANSAFASLTFNYTVDTSSLENTTNADGYLYFQFNPYAGDHGLTAPAANATIENFTITGAGSIASAYDYSASTVTGTLDLSKTSSGYVTMSNAGQLNDYNHAIHFGDSFKFTVVFDGPAVTNPNGIVTTFSLGLFSDEADTQALLTSNGTVVAQDTPSPTPIPAAVYLLGSGLMGLVGIRRKKQK